MGGTVTKTVNVPTRTQADLDNEKKLKSLEAQWQEHLKAVAERTTVAGSAEQRVSARSHSTATRARAPAFSVNGLPHDASTGAETGSLCLRAVCVSQLKEAQDAAVKAREAWQREKVDWDARVTRIATEAATSRQAAENKAAEALRTEATRAEQRVSRRHACP